MKELKTIAQLKKELNKTQELPFWKSIEADYKGYAIAIQNCAGYYMVMIDNYDADDKDFDSLEEAKQYVINKFSK